MCAVPMGTAGARASSRLELADIVRAHGDAYRRTHRLARVQHVALRAIATCRTALLGGHRETCDRCGAERITYNSCRNRHCPKCQTLTKERWLAARRAELLPIPYFHVVFTLPHDLNALAQGNPRVLYALLFRAAADTLLTFGRDPRHLGGTIGITAILHTWGQSPHATPPSPLPGHRRRLGRGPLALDRRAIGLLVSCPGAPRVFRAKYLAGLQRAFADRPPGLRRGTADLADRRAFTASSVSCEPSTGSCMRSAPSPVLSRCSTTSGATPTASRCRMIGSSITMTVASASAGRTTPTTTAGRS